MSTTPAPSTRARRWWTLAGVVVGAVALYGLLGGLVLPHFARKAAVEKLGDGLGRTVVIDDVSVNPYTLAATVKGLRILEADGKAAFASFDQLDLDASILSLRHFAPVFDAVTLDGLKVNIVRESDSRYNVTDILGRLADRAAKTPKSDGDKSQFSVNNIRVKNARVDFEDRPKGAKHQVTDIEMAIPFVSNLPTHLKDYVRPSFAAKVNGSGLMLTGESQPFENSLRTHLSIDVDSLDVTRYVEYSPSALPVKVDSGKLDAKLSVRFTQSAGKQASVDIAGTLGLRELRVSSAEGDLAQVGRIEADIASFDPLAGALHASALRIVDLRANKDEWRVPSAEARDIRADLHSKDVRIASLATKDGTFGLKRLRDGSIELPMQLPKSEPPHWTIAVAKATLDGYAVTVADASVKPATTHRVAITHLEASDLGTARGTKSAISAKLGLGKSGSAEIESTLVFDPLTMDARVDARRVDLVPMRPYIDKFATVALKSGQASAKGHLVVKSEGGSARIAYTGTAEVANVATSDTLSREDLLNWDSVKATGIGFKYAQSEPLELSIADIAVNKAYSRLVVLPEGKLNLQQLMAATPGDPNAPAPPPEPEKAQGRNVRIDRITFADSRLNFTDLYIKPNFSADVGELNGTVTNLSSDPATRGVVDLKGAYDKVSPVVIAGTVNPLSANLFVDIAAKGKDIELPTLTAYSQRYAGYGITKGKLTLDVKYHVEDGQMEGRNRIFIEQLTFGDRIEGPDATKLPVLFAVNLLKNSKGEIDLELPVSGSLADPKFNIGGLISQVFVNLLKKAVTAPFSLLAAAFGGSGNGDAKNGAAHADSGEDLAFVDFEPGRAELGPAGTKKLDRLSKALLERPAIRIEMAGHADADKDLVALKRAALQRKVKAAKQRALGKSGASADEIAVSAEEYPRYLKAAFDAEKIAREEKKEPSTAEMEALLLDRIAIGEPELGALAQRRSEQVKGYLMGAGQLPAERVLVAAAPESVAASRVSFKLQ